MTPQTANTRGMWSQRNSLLPSQLGITAHNGSQRPLQQKTRGRWGSTSRATGPIATGLSLLPTGLQKDGPSPQSHCCGESRAGCTLPSRPACLLACLPATRLDLKKFRARPETKGPLCPVPTRQISSQSPEATGMKSRGRAKDCTPNTQFSESSLEFLTWDMTLSMRCGRLGSLHKHLQFSCTTLYPPFFPLMVKAPPHSLAAGQGSGDRQTHSEHRPLA